MTARLHGKVALITGGASGIGLGTAQRFVAEGAQVMLADLNGDAATTAADVLGPNAAAVACDVTDEAQVAAMVAATVERFGGLDIAVNSAGAGDYSFVVDSDVERFRFIVDLCLVGVFTSMKHEAPAMRDGGSIINIASINAFVPAHGMSAYCSAKAGVEMLTKCAAMEMGPRLRVNALAPGLIDTPITKIFFDVGTVHDDFVANTTMGRAGQPADVAAAALYLASDDASWVSGEMLVVDGGGSTGRYPRLPDHFAALGL